MRLLSLVPSLVFGFLLLPSCSGGGGGGPSGSSTTRFVAVSSSSEELLVGDPTSFTATLDPDDPGATVRWTVAGTFVRQGRTAKVTFSGPGLAEVTATATLSNGRVLEGGTVVSVYPRTGALGVGFGSPAAVPGDADGDGKVSIRDALLVRRVLDGGPGTASATSTVAFGAADLNVNGDLDAEDVDLIQCIVQDQAVLPTVLRPSAGHPGTAVQVIAPALTTLGAAVQIQFGNEPPITPFRPRLGYANTIVPLELRSSLPAGVTAIPVRILVDGQVATTLEFSATPTPPATRTARDALRMTPTLLRDALRGAMTNLGPALQTVTAESSEVAALAAVTSGAMNYLDEAVTEIQTFLDASTAAQQDLLYEVGRANGIEDYLTTLEGLTATAQANTGPTTSARVILAVLCDLQTLKDNLDVPARAAAIACAGVGALALAFPPSAIATVAIAVYCTKILTAVSLVQLAFSFVPTPPTKLDVSCTPPKIGAGETTEIAITYRIGVLQAICSGAFTGLTGSVFNGLGKVVAGFGPARRQAWELAKKWPVRSSQGNLVASLTKAIQDFYAAATGAIASLPVINQKLVGLQASLCGATTLDPTFELEPQVVLSGVPEPQVGTLTIPPPGVLARATYTCPPSMPAGAGNTVSFDAFFSYSQCMLDGRGSVECGSFGAVTICYGDNGSLLDDFFELILDGTTVLAPSAAVVRVCTPPLSLATGRHVAQLKGLAAPDGIGTYFISFSGNVQNIAGPPLTGTNLVPGVTLTWTFDVVEN